MAETLLALSMRRLRDLHPAACDTDARVLLAPDCSLSVKTSHGTFPLRVCGTRELRLLAKQLEWFADHLDRDRDEDFVGVSP